MYMYMECSKKHPAETSGKYNTVNVEIFEQTKFRLVSSSSTNVNFRLRAWSVIPNGHDADVNVLSVSKYCVATCYRLWYKVIMYNYKDIWSAEEGEVLRCVREEKIHS